MPKDLAYDGDLFRIENPPVSRSNAWTMDLGAADCGPVSRHLGTDGAMPTIAAERARGSASPNRRYPDL